MSNRILRYATGVNSKGPSDQSFEPDVAAALPEQPDAQTITIKVREGITFHDIAPVNGRALTAEDVAYSIQRYKEVGNNATKLAALESVEATDPTTVTIKLNRPTASLIATLADHSVVWMLAKEVVDGKELQLGDPFIGTGPFMFDSYDTDVQINYVKNPNYWETGFPYVERVERPIVSQAATLDANFRSGQFDILANLSEAERFDEIRKGQGVQSMSYLTNGMRRKEFALHVEPFNNPMVRQALNMATDRDEIGLGLGAIDFKWHTHAFPASFAPWYLDPQGADFGENAKYFQYNPEEAKALLAAAGYDDGFEFDFIFTTEYSGEQLQAEIQVDQFSRIGVKMNLRALPYTEYQQRYKTGPLENRLWEGMLGNAPASFPDPSGYFDTYWAPKASRGTQLFEDATYEQMLTEQDRELDNEARRELIWEIQRYMAAEAHGIPLYTGASGLAWQPWVKNFHYKASYGNGVETVARLWIDKA